MNEEQTGMIEGIMAHEGVITKETVDETTVSEDAGAQESETTPKEIAEPAEELPVGGDTKPAEELPAEKIVEEAKSAAPKEEAKPAPELDEVGQLKEQVATLTGLVNKFVGGEGIAEALGVEVEKKEDEVKEPDIPYEDKVFFKTDDELNEFVGSREGANKVLQKVYNAAVEKLYTTVPDIAANVAKQQIHVDRRVQSYFDDNKVLVPHREVFAQVCGAISAKDPNLSLDDVLDKGGELIRTAMKLPLQEAAKEDTAKDGKKAETTDAGKGEKPNPAFAPTPASRGGAPLPKGGKKVELTGAQKDIQDMVDFAEKEK